MLTAGNSQNSALVPNKDDLNDAELFEIIYNGDGTISLKTTSSRTNESFYVHVESNQLNKPIKANSARTYGDEEKFYLNFFDFYETD
ncbi:fascin domain-containing protein [Paenibacillus hexagrammi]|uniref:Uncharacterized protein n=1 Tax=Paenibacillus hexagrammi TaxID=2908839 RepID=A0ABY3SPJ7_9BACL|nr:hypothetical protein [Paenibacillus sp. YPD9-1]UJF35978.1 hypothetical protein L0M14_13365 [Paenibacillus sp. YPD9-1]